MEFRILGPLEVEQDGTSLPLGSRQPRTVLAVLLLNANRVVSRDRLIDAVWGADPPERAANALQVYVSQLRKALGRDVIVTQQPGYVVRIEPDALDLSRFEALLADAAGADAESAATSLRAALALWRGPALADLDDIPVLDVERRRLEELRLGALEGRVEADLERGEHLRLVPELEALVAEHPLRERLRGQLMLALYRSGRQAEALAVYRRGQRLLAEELGLEPSEPLKRLERSILDQDPALAGPPPRRGRFTVPTGTVTFLFTDIEGSTRLMEELGDDEYGTLLDEHNRLLRKALLDHGGLEIASQADAFFFAFRRARDAVAAAIDVQRATLGALWPRAAAVRVRVGIHTGEPGIAEGGYHGLDVVRAARISGAAHGGQILVSSATRHLSGSSAAGGYMDLGEHTLPELPQPQRIFQVLAPGLPDAFPDLRSQDGARVMPIRGREEELAAAAEAAVGADERRVRLFRRSGLVALAGAVIVGATAAAIGLTVATGGGTPVTVRANSVAVVDPSSNEVVADVPVGSRPVAVAVGLGGVWVANADDGTVQRIDPKTHRVTATIGIGSDVSDIAVGFGSVWVAGGNDSTLTRIDPNPSPGVRATQHFGTNSLTPEPIFSVATGPEGVWFTRGSTLVLLDPRSDRRVRSYPIPSPISITTGGRSVWVTTQDERLLRYSTSGAPTGSLALPAGAVADYGLGSLWAVVYIGSGAVWAIDPASVTASATVTLPGSPVELAVGEGAVWTVNADGTLTRIAANSAQVVRTIKLGLAPSAVAAGEGGIWAAVQKPQ